MAICGEHLDLPICGRHDIDELFAFKTAKVVVLKDRHLGFLSLGLQAAICFYIFGYLIIYQGKHLDIADIDGVFRVTLQHPTKDMCNPDDVDCSSNFTSLDKLPYCTQSREPYVTKEGKTGNKKKCRMFDAVESFVEHEQGVVVPTRIRRYNQVRGCKPSEATGWSCDGSPFIFVNDDFTPQNHEGKATVMEDVFASDIDRFTVMFDHSFRQLGGSGLDDHDMIAYWLDCPSIDVPSSDCTRKELLCVHGDCPHGARRPMRDRRLAEKATMAESTVVGKSGRTLMTLPNGEVGISIKKGDVFRLGSLLNIADVGLDEMGGFDKTFRERGIAVVIQIIYDNRPLHFIGVKVTPWHNPKPHYTYRVTTRSTDDFQKTKTFDDPMEDNRTTHKYNGIRLVVEQSGEIASFRISNFLVTMTVALGLLKVAKFLTEMAMLYFLKKAHLYKKHKFHHSKDFHRGDDEAEQASVKPRNKQEAAECLLQAIEGQDVDAVIDCFPSVVDLLGKK